MTSIKTLEYIQINSGHPAKLCIIWLHGLGADGNDFVSLVPELKLSESLPAQFIFPHAPVRPITINGNVPMRAWYDIYSLSRIDHEDIQGLKETQRDLNRLIDQQIDAGFKPDQIILAGFSQGGAAALYTGLRYPKALGGIIALSCYLPASTFLAAEASEENKKIPIFLTHGQRDEVLPFQLAEKSREILLSLGYEVTWKAYSMGHEVCYEEIQDLSRWLND